MSENSTKIAASLARMAREHGAPNNFAVGEVADDTGLTPLVIGRVIAQENIILADKLRARGFKYGGAMTHHGRRWVSVEAL